MLVVATRSASHLIDAHEVLVIQGFQPEPAILERWLAVCVGTVHHPAHQTRCAFQPAWRTDARRP